MAPEAERYESAPEWGAAGVWLKFEAVQLAAEDRRLESQSH